MLKIVKRTKNVLKKLDFLLLLYVSLRRETFVEILFSKSLFFYLFCLLTATKKCGKMAGPFRSRGPEFCQDGRLHKFSPQILCILTIDFYPEMVYTIIRKRTEWVKNYGNPVICCIPCR